MINTKHLLKVTSAWISIIYVICYFGIAVWPPIRLMTMRYAMHMDWNSAPGYFGLGYFVSGLIIWNVVALFSAWLFAWLFNAIKQ